MCSLRNVVFLMLIKITVTKHDTLKLTTYFDCSYSQSLTASILYA